MKSAISDCSRNALRRELLYLFQGTGQIYSSESIASQAAGISCQVRPVSLVWSFGVDGQARPPRLSARDGGQVTIS